MIYKTISGLARYMANIAQQDVCRNESGRWIFRENQFTDDDRAKIKQREAAIKDILQNANYNVLTNVLTLLKAQMPRTFIGFQLQQEIVETCSHCGIYIEMRSSNESSYLVDGVLQKRPPVVSCGQ